ncbi:MAG: DUF2490 domain-containing protein, partial [Verrucomicrobiota bacterium]|nr:DUF2490 domain-containing protein [Verrucomicrobiota bacterium]
TESVVKTFNSRCALHLANEWRIGDDISKLYHVYLQGILKVSLTDRIDIAPGYRQTWRLRQNQWRLDEEPLFELFFHAGDQFQVRNRISYVIREAAMNFWQYRLRLRYIYTDWKVHPFVSNEIFVISRDGFSENRTIAGVSVPLSCFSDWDFYAMLRFLKTDPSWTHQYIFGTHIHFYF